MSEQEQLLNDEQVEQIRLLITDAVIRPAQKMRDEYEAELARLREELGDLQDTRAQNAMLCAEIRLVQKRVRELEAEQEWEPVEDGWYHRAFGATISVIGNSACVFEDVRRKITAILPDDVRLMRRRPQVQP